MGINKMRPDKINKALRLTNANPSVKAKAISELTREEVDVYIDQLLMMANLLVTDLTSK